MAIEVYEFAVTIPAGTLKTALSMTSCKLPMRRVDRIEIKVPPGPRGLMGFQIGGSKQQFIPRGAGQFVVTDDEEISWDIVGAFDSGDWWVMGYNSGTYDHTIYVRFLVSLVGKVTATAQPIALEALNA